MLGATKNYHWDFTFLKLTLDSIDVLNIQELRIKTIFMKIIASFFVFVFILDSSRLSVSTVACCVFFPPWLINKNLITQLIVAVG